MWIREGLVGLPDFRLWLLNGGLVQPEALLLREFVVDLL